MPPLNIRPLCSELRIKAETELGENPLILETDLELLRSWLEKQPHLRSRTDDQFLVSFLRGCKFSLERTKEKLDTYHTVRSALPEFFKNRDPADEKIRKTLKLGVGCYLPLTDGPAGPRITLIRPYAYDPNKVPIADIMKVSSMIFDLMMMEDDNLIISGEVDIIDLKNVTTGHLMHMSPDLLRKMTMVGEKSTPLRLKSMNFINMPHGMETTVNLFRGFMSEKMNATLHLHGRLETLYDEVPQKLLPAEYGGEAGRIQDITDNWLKKIDEYREWFLEDETYGCDETKRPTIYSPLSTSLDLQGSFRQLIVD